MRDRMTTRLVRAAGGKSHSWLTPTTSRSKPRANRISVAEGRRETMRITRDDFSISGAAERKERPARFARESVESRSLGPAQDDRSFWPVPASTDELLVEEIFVADGVEGVEIGGPAGHDLIRGDSFLQL